MIIKNSVSVLTNCWSSPPFSCITKRSGLRPPPSHLSRVILVSYAGNGVPWVTIVQCSRTAYIYIHSCVYVFIYISLIYICVYGTRISVYDHVNLVIYIYMGYLYLYLHLYIRIYCTYDHVNLLIYIYGVRISISTSIYTYIFIYLQTTDE